MAIVVKAFIETTSASEEPAVRRFILREAEATNYSLLREKIGHMLDKSFENGFSILWKDDEGDDVTVSSNEELQEAVASVKKGILKLYIRKSEPMDQPQNNTDSIHGDIHPFVLCDGCHKNIRGFRYKCTQCVDFDLCSTCESQGQHSHHIMMRLPANNGNTIPKQQQQQSEQANLNDFFSTLLTSLGGPCVNSDEQNQGPAQRKESSAKQEQEPQPNSNLSGLNDIFLALQTALGVPLVNSEQQQAHGAGSADSSIPTNQHQQQPNNPHGLNEFFHILQSVLRVPPMPTEQQQAQGAGSADNSGTSTDQHQQQPNNQCGLNDIFQMLQSVLRVPPMPTEQQQAQGAGSADSSTPTDQYQQQPNNQHGFNNFVHILQSVFQVPPMPTDQQNQRTGCPLGNQSSSDQHSDLHDAFSRIWTELGRDTSHCAQHNTTAGASNASDNPNNAGINPSLKPHNILDAVRETVTALLEPRDYARRNRISEATDSMLAMGFTNEQEWITRLLELTNGNLNQVLDIIDTVRDYAGDKESVPQIVISLFDAYSTNPQLVLRELQSLKRVGHTMQGRTATVA